MKKTFLCLACAFLLCLTGGCADGRKQGTGQEKGSRVTFLYNYEGKTTVLEDRSGAIAAPEVSEREGYDFGGWAYAWREDGEPELWDFERDEVTRDTCLTAVWTPRQVTVFLDTDGGTGCPDRIVTSYGKPLSLPEPKKAGAWFLGWGYAAYRSNFQHKTVDFVNDIYLKADWLYFDPAMTVRFGRFEQDNVDNGPEDLDWYVLDIADGKYILLSQKAIYSMTYEAADPGAGKCTYEKSAIRVWLNRDFYDAAFSEAEKSFMCPIDLGELGGTDNVTLMSNAERDRYLIQWRCDQLAASPTEYALASGLDMRSYGEYKGTQCCSCWLRHEKKEREINYPSYASFYYSMINGYRARYGIRPTIVVDERAFPSPGN